MIYVMGKQLYEEYTTDKQGYKGLKHKELIQHVNQTFGLRGTITKIKVGE